MTCAPRPVSPPRRPPTAPSRRARVSVRPLTGLLGLIGLLVALGSAAPAPVRAGELPIYEASVGPGATRLLATPAANVGLDLDYAPASAEGGGLFGFSELRLVTTGDVQFTATGFWCEVTACLHFPLPFAAGTELVVTGGEDLQGELATSLDLVTVSVSGTNGLVVAVSGEYLDATGPAGGPGAIQPIDVTVLAAVPEPATGIGVGLGALALALAARRRRGVPVSWTARIGSSPR